MDNNIKKIAWNKGIKIVPRIKIRCTGCQKEFELTKNEYEQRLSITKKKHLFCSKQCFYTHRGGFLNPQFGCKKREIRKCIRCNKVFEVIPSSKKIYCTKSCQIDSLKEKNFYSILTKLGKINYNFRDPERIRKIGETSKERWKDPIYREKVIKKIREKRLLQIMPTKDTKIEIMMQKALEEKSINFISHYPIQFARTQVDIVILTKKIAIYCDGDYWHSFPEIKKKDERQTKILQEEGWIVFRFSENKINKNLQDCINLILKEVCESNE